LPPFVKNSSLEHAYAEAHPDSDLSGFVDTLFVRLGGIVDDVRSALDQNNFSAAERALTSYRAGKASTRSTRSLLVLGRAALEQRQYEQAAGYARQTKTMVVEQLNSANLMRNRTCRWRWAQPWKSSRNPWPPGARGRKRSRSCKRSADVWNDLDPREVAEELESAVASGQTCPSLKAAQSLGANLPPIPAQGLARFAVLLAHWCADCKAEAPSSRSCAPSSQPRMKVIGPRSFMAITAQVEHASRALN